MEKLLDKINYKSEDGELSVDVHIDPDNNTVWLTQKQIAELFGKGVPSINEHIKNIYRGLILAVCVFGAQMLISYIIQIEAIFKIITKYFFCQLDNRIIQFRK